MNQESWCRRLELQIGESSIFFEMASPSKSSGARPGRILTSESHHRMQRS